MKYTSVGANGASYDALNRIASKSSNDGTVNTNVYRDDDNRAQVVTSPTSNTYYAFDALGGPLPARKRHWDKTLALTIATMRRPFKMNGGPGYPSFLQFNQSFSYDALNRLTGVNDSGGYVRNFQYDPWGNMSVPNSTGVPLYSLTPLTSGNPYNTATNRLWAGTYDGAGN